jgi:hypothetical protein
MMSPINRVLSGSTIHAWGSCMQKKLLAVLTALGCALLFAGIATAHHGVAGYDMTKTVTLHGTVTKFDWGNPHVVVYLDAKPEGGEMQHWTIEFASPVHMVRAGWSKSSMKTGDDIVIEAHPSRNGAPVGITSTITFILKTVINGQALPSRSE